MLEIPVFAKHANVFAHKVHRIQFQHSSTDKSIFVFLIYHLQERIRSANTFRHYQNIIIHQQHMGNVSSHMEGLIHASGKPAGTSDIIIRMKFDMSGLDAFLAQCSAIINDIYIQMIFYLIVAFKQFCANQSDILCDEIFFPECCRSYCKIDCFNSTFLKKPIKVSAFNNTLCICCQFKCEELI